VLSGIDLTGRLAIVTGGYSGIGTAVTRGLSDAGATVVVPARRPDQAREVLGGVAGAEVAELDLADLGSVERFAQEFLQRHLTLREMRDLGWYDDQGNLAPLVKTPEQGAAGEAGSRLAAARRDGVPDFGRRRATGLRREELATLAGVSSPYYTRLEQGRDRHPSPQILEAIGRALGLDEQAMAHLHRLAQAHPLSQFSPPRAEEVADGLRFLLDTWTAQPAVVIGRYRDVLAANRIAQVLNPGFVPGRNLLRHVFLDPEGRQYYVRARISGRKRYNNPFIGLITLDYETFTVNADPGRPWRARKERAGVA
jgi:transcriptional regulator with XRE-family HTH domain